MAYHDQITQAQTLIEGQSTWNSISPESVARMRLQNRFQTGLDIARYTAKIMREDMAAMGPVRLRDVDEAQMYMVQVAKDLAARGEIVMAEGKGEDELIY